MIKKSNTLLFGIIVLASASMCLGLVNLELNFVGILSLIFMLVGETIIGYAANVPREVKKNE